MAGFWEYFLNSGLQKPDDPGDPSMPYGPPLWPQPQPDLPWATRSADPNEIAAQRVRDKYHADRRAPARWPEFLANVVPNTLYYIGDLGNRMALSAQRMNDPFDGVYDPAPFVEAATMLYGTGGAAAMTPGMRGALGATGGKLTPQPGAFSIPAPRGRVWSDLSLTAHRPIEEMTDTRVPTGSLQPYKTLDPAALQGSILMPAVGDRTTAGSTLTHINELPLSRPVTLEGGPDFMRSAANTHDSAVWASDKAPASKMANFARELGADGRDVNLVYSAMSAQSGDRSHMTADALLGQLTASPITRQAAVDFDTRMAAQNQVWPGLRSPLLSDTLMSNPALREQFVREMALGRHQTSGFPDIASTRKAISEPALLGQPTGVSGYAVSKLDPASRIISEPTVPHSTYSTQVSGGPYMGGIDTPIPRELMFPDFFAKRRAAGAPPFADDRAFSLGNVSQDANQQWLDMISQYIEQRKLQGR